jgi:nicotinamide mononucleotide (NMN) deamidase PncC
VDPELILEHGVVDDDVALQMALGVQLRPSINDVPTTWGLSTTGIASGWVADKKHGTVFIGSRQMNIVSSLDRLSLKGIGCGEESYG